MEINKHLRSDSGQNNLFFCWDVHAGHFVFSQQFYYTFISKEKQLPINLISKQLPFEGACNNYITAMLQECYFSNTALTGYFQHRPHSEVPQSHYRIRLISKKTGEPPFREIMALIDEVDSEYDANANDPIIRKWNRLNMLHDALIELDENQSITLANLGWEKHLGISYWLLFSGPFSNLIHPNDRPLWNTHFKQNASKAVDSSILSIRMLHSSREAVVMHFRISQTSHSENGLRKTYVFSPSQNFDQLTSSVYHQKINIENVHDGIAIINTQMQFIYMNQTHVELFGYTSELELIGKPWHILYDFEERQRIENEIFPILKTQKSIQFESRGIKKNGGLVFQNICLTRLPDGEIICTKYDITERKEQENRLKEIALIAKLTTMMVSVMNKHGEITWINNAFSQKTGWQIEDMMGKSFLNLLEFENVLFKEADGIVLSIEKGCLYHGEHRLANKNKSIIWVNSNLTPVQNASGEWDQFILIQNDITLRKKAENDILHSFQKEQELNRLKNEFIQLTSHEFRTPMASIYTSMDVMKFHLKNADLNSFKSVFERHYTKVIKEINRLEKTMDHILVLGHLDTGKIVFKPEPVDLKQLIEKIIQEYLLFLENRKAKLLVKGEPKILDIDSNFMHYIVTNLIDNAFKFGSPDEEPQVLLSFEKNAVSLSVEDSGIGIPSEEIHKLFDSFYRASNTECTPGTGLGLVIVKRLTELHGGEVFVKSELNGGTVFTITLPNGTHEK